MSENFGRYELMERLGYGGMAEVFLARTNSVAGFEKHLAIKRLLPHCTEDQQTVDLLADEARITVQLTHPNIVQVFDFGQIDGSYFIAMEFVDGLDLKTLVQIDEERSRPLPLDVALHVVISVLEGLDFAHKRKDAQGEELGIIHRDVSPHNVLISRHGQIKLTDFGVARARISSHVSVVGDIRGKFSYMPPEQACGGEIDHRVDIFAAGAILYELLSGVQPFRSTSTGEQMKLLSSKIPPPSSILASIPSAVDRIVLRALATDPAKRFTHAGAFAVELKEQLQLLGAERLSAQQTLVELIDERFAACEEQPLGAGEESQIGSFAELAEAYADSVIFAASEQRPEQATGEIPMQGGGSTYDDDSLRGAPSVAFSDALLQEAALATGEHGPFSSSAEERTDVVGLPEQSTSELAQQSPLAYAATAVQLEAAALGPIDAVDSDADATRVHHNPLEAHVLYDGGDEDLPTAAASPSALADVARPGDSAPLMAARVSGDEHPTDRQQRIDISATRPGLRDDVQTAIHLDLSAHRDEAQGSAHDAPEHLPPDEPVPARHPRAVEVGRPTLEVEQAQQQGQLGVDDLGEITLDETPEGPSSQDETPASLGRYAMGAQEGRRLGKGDPTPASFATGRDAPALDAAGTEPARRLDASDAFDNLPERLEPADRELAPATSEARAPRERPWLRWVLVGGAVLLGVVITVTVAMC